MKCLHISFILLLFVVSCKTKDEKAVPLVGIKDSSMKTETPSFFPVTQYIKGQIFEIKNGHINPLKIVQGVQKTDSSWIKMESLDKEVADFLSPEIDSANLTSLFLETKFFDQTLDAITLTYDPIKTLPDSFLLKHWNIYIDPSTGNIKQVYLLKIVAPNKIQQLTWVAGKSCNIKTIVDSANGKSSIEKEVTLKWAL